MSELLDLQKTIDSLFMKTAHIGAIDLSINLHVTPMVVISGDEFLTALSNNSEIKVDLRTSNPNVNLGTRDTVISPMGGVQFIIAGPGTGKTTTMVIRTLYLLFVEDVIPSSIILTTFTRKAAEELKSRVQGWGQSLQDYFIQIGREINIHFNSINVGTLDALMKEWLTQSQVSQGLTGGMIDIYGSRLLMTREYIKLDYNTKDLISDYLLYLSAPDENNIPKKSAYNSSNWSVVGGLLKLEGRLIGDLINLDEYKDTPIMNDNLLAVIDVIQRYWHALREKSIYTYSTIALYFLYLLDSKSKIIDNSLLNAVFQSSDLLYPVSIDKMFKEISHLFIDEYQDTNYIQEQIYFKLVSLISRDNLNYTLTVVGDDDQSIYRFRGSTVELFTEFTNRLCDHIAISIDQITMQYLSVNYRSTNSIIDFINKFIDLNSEYQKFRVIGKSDLISGNVRNYDPPILLISGDNKEDIANNISSFLLQLTENGIKLDQSNSPYTLDSSSNLGDVIYLATTVKEKNTVGKANLIAILREKLGTHNLSIFNPQGIFIIDILEVQQLLGLIHLILDPDLTITRTINLKEIAITIALWRMAAEDFIASNSDKFLGTYVDMMQNKIKRDGTPWNFTTISISNLIFDLLKWFDYFQQDKEGIAYLSALTSMLSQMELVSNHGQTVNYDPNDPNRWNYSVKSIIWDFYVPIAANTMEVDESLLDTVTMDRLNVKTIHASKGLEFPIVIVDIGSEVSGNFPYVRFKYYPCDGSSDVRLTEKISPFTTMSVNNISSIHVSFADIIRKFYVAYSRAESLLILTGTHKAFGSILEDRIDPGKPINLTQLGWYYNDSQGIAIDRRQNFFGSIKIMEYP